MTEVTTSEDDRVYPEDDAAQHHADLEIVAGALMETRRELSSAKIRSTIATQVGIPGQHPNGIKDEVVRLSKTVVVLTSLLVDLRADDAATVPMPSGLAVVQGVG